MAEAALPTDALRERVARCSFTPRIRTPRYIRFDVRAAANRRAHERKDLYDSGVVRPERGSGGAERRGTWTSAKLGDDIPSARRFAERPSGIRIHAGARRWALMDEAARATCVDFLRRNERTCLGAKRNASRACGRSTCHAHCSVKSLRHSIGSKQRCSRSQSHFVTLPPHAVDPFGGTTPPSLPAAIHPLS
jgi:hypothetical protein